MRGQRVFTTVAIFLALAVSAASAQTYKVLYTLGTDPNDPFNPSAIGLMSQGRDANIYTTSQFGGAKAGKEGTAFEFTTLGSVTRLWDFDPYPSASSPWSGLTMGTDGNFYGTTTSGGIHISGTVFKLSEAGVFTVLWEFSGSGTDEGGPAVAPVLGPDGNYYGTTNGIYAGTYGTAYRITSKGALKTLHVFKFTDGATPYGLILGPDGFFYGTTRAGGTNNCGVVFRMSKSGAVKVLHSFTCSPTDGALPIGTLVQGGDGTLYGTTYLGGTKNWGTVFKISPTGAGYKILHNFDRTLDINDGIQPLAGMVMATDGNLYGNTSSGGKNNAGVLFKITPAGQYSTLYSFCSAANCKDGGGPQTPLLQNTNGTLYGMTRGNSLGGSVIFSLDMGLGPFIGLVSISGKVGTTMQILGQGFTGTTSVKLGGTAANFNVVSDTYLTATVPAGSSGSVTVTTPTGTLTSNRKFYVLPTISGFTPASGAVGSQVVITGSGLIQASKVAFGSKSATFVVNSDKQVTATVPAGAVTSKIAITTPGGKATSKTAFTVTP